MRSVKLSTGMLLMIVLTVAGADDSNMIPLKPDGPASAVVVAQGLSGEAQRAVAELVEYIHQSVGVKLAVESASMDKRFEIHVGPTDYVQSLNLPAGELDADGFRIFCPIPDRLVLIGGKGRGTEFAIYEFLERCVGVRWLYPGPSGTHVPKASALPIPDEIASRPAYISRTISTFRDPERPDAGDWLRHHRQNWTISHHHNLNKLISPDEFYESHPEFFPLINGKREKPEPEGYGWQPVLHADGIVQASIDKITKYFDENAHATSFSLGINDNNNFENAPDAGMNSVDLLDYSDYFFTYANAVVEGVLKKHPDKWFGCLAYVGVTDPPEKSGVNPRIVPHICIDRQGWASEEHAQRDMKRTRDWHAAAPTLGWYDYIYGDEMYRIPRIYNHLMARYVKFGAENGVKAMYAEHYASPAWIEGPKLYVFLKLLWDPNADVDAITSEWYRLAVGDQAAEPLAKYFGFWEDYWMTRVPKTDWFQQYANRVYMNFVHTGYLDELTMEDLDACGKWMEQVVALAQTPEQKARAQFLADGFAGVRREVEYVIQSKDQTAAAQGHRLIDDTFSPASAELDEKIPAPWSSWQNEPGTARFIYDHANGQGDTHCLTIDAANAGTSAVFYQRLKFEKPAALYQMTADVQCNDDVNPDAYVGIGITWSKLDGSYLPSKYSGNRFWTASTYKPGQWRPLSVQVRPPPVDGPVEAMVALTVTYGKKGTVRFDNVRLIEVPE